MFDVDDPPCIGRYGFGSGFFTPEFEEAQRAGLKPSGHCVDGCPLKEDCVMFSLTMAGLDWRHPCQIDTGDLIARNWKLGRASREKAARR